MESNIIEDLGMIGIKPSGIKYRKLLVECEDCNKQWEVQRDNWINRKTNKCLSCACHLRTHGKTGTILHDRWTSMNQRCTEEYRQKCYHGTYVCEEWKDFEVFESWALANGFSPELELDKDIICNRENISPKYYSPETCMWITKQENIANSTHYLRDKFYAEPTCGIQIKTLKSGTNSFCLTHKGKVVGTRPTMEKAIELKQQYIGEENAINRRYV